MSLRVWILKLFVPRGEQPARASKNKRTGTCWKECWKALRLDEPEVFRNSVALSSLVGYGPLSIPKAASGAIDLISTIQYLTNQSSAYDRIIEAFVLVRIRRSLKLYSASVGRTVCLLSTEKTYQLTYVMFSPTLTATVNPRSARGSPCLDAQPLLGRWPIRKRSILRQNSRSRCWFTNSTLDWSSAFVFILSTIQ